MKIQFLYTKDCHVWNKSLELFKDIIRTSDFPIKDFKITLVETKKQAQLYKFLGSPTILIDGIDLDPMARGLTNYALSSCRPYFYKGRSYDYPPKEMILEALTRYKDYE